MSWFLDTSWKDWNSYLRIEITLYNNWSNIEICLCLSFIFRFLFFFWGRVSEFCISISLVWFGLFIFTWWFTFCVYDFKLCDPFTYESEKLNVFKCISWETSIGTKNNTSLQNLNNTYQFAYLLSSRIVESEGFFRWSHSALSNASSIFPLCRDVSKLIFATRFSSLNSIFWRVIKVSKE